MRLAVVGKRVDRPDLVKGKHVPAAVEPVPVPTDNRVQGVLEARIPASVYIRVNIDM
jgi:hypothetical protein